MAKSKVVKRWVAFSFADKAAFNAAVPEITKAIAPIPEPKSGPDFAFEVHRDLDGISVHRRYARSITTHLKNAEIDFTKGQVDWLGHDSSGFFHYPELRKDTYDNVDWLNRESALLKKTNNIARQVINSRQPAP